MTNPSVPDFDWASLLTDAGLTLTCHTWIPPQPDPLTVSNWWSWREDCGCPDTSFGRNPHRWDCWQTPLWERTIRDGYIPSMSFGGEDV